MPALTAAIHLAESRALREAPGLQPASFRKKPIGERWFANRRFSLWLPQPNSIRGAPQQYPFPAIISAGLCGGISLSLY